MIGLSLNFLHPIPNNLGSEPNLNWARNQLRIGLTPKSDLGSDPNPTCALTQIGFGLGPKSGLGSDPSRFLFYLLFFYFLEIFEMCPVC